MPSPDYDYNDYEDYYSYSDLEAQSFSFLDQNMTRFASTGSALRAACPNNPRNIPCPTCGEPNRLTPIDQQLGYQCDECADNCENGW